MIGYDATNTIAQSIAIREKIYLFSLSYFAFFYKNLPLFSFKFESAEFIVSSLSEKIYEYFELYVVKTESDDEPQLFKKPLAKYYLAAIFYYEPTFDFESSNINEIEDFGKIYLRQLFQENMLYFIENAKKYVKDNQLSPEYDSKWKYFAYAMLRSQYNDNFLNIIQQPVSYVSRKNLSALPGQPEISFFSQIQDLLFNEINEVPLDNIITEFVGSHENKDLVQKNVITKEYWDDAPNIIKYFIKNKTNDSIQVANCTQTSTSLLKEEGDAKGFISVYKSIAYSYPPLAYADDQKKYQSPDKVEISTFFEFSFQPNYDKITNKFPALKQLINKNSFDIVKNSYFLKLSKTETYDFMKNLLGQNEKFLKGISEEEFSSFFDLQVALLYKISKRYFAKDFIPLTPGYGDINLDNSSFGIRSWTATDVALISPASILYNPLIKPEENISELYKTIKKRKKYALNRALTLGNAFDDFDIVIRTFNPQQAFLNNDLLNKIIAIIDEAKTDEAKIIKQEFVKNLDYNPFDFTKVAGDFLAIEASQMPKNLVNQNIALFSKPYSEFSKNLLDNLITNAEKVK